MLLTQPCDGCQKFCSQADGTPALKQASAEGGRGGSQAGAGMHATRDARGQLETGARAADERGTGTDPVEVVARALAVEGSHGTRAERVVIGP